eukprot:8922797-Ditylum_brightwellii.AAC.1
MQANRPLLTLSSQQWIIYITRSNTAKLQKAYNELEDNRYEVYNSEIGNILLSKIQDSNV